MTKIDRILEELREEIRWLILDCQNRRNVSADRVISLEVGVSPDETVEDHYVCITYGITTNTPRG